MIKRETTLGKIDVITYICDNAPDCLKELPGAPIMVYYPFGHINDSLDGPSHFCSDKCLVAFEEKLMKKYGPWKSETIISSKKVRGSGDWRKSQGVAPRPKARRVIRRKRIKRRKTGKGNT